ncbi:carbohydrate binding domain-containing protein, partial [Streptomyces sp. TRM76130]|nr:carbohydrate binding domain-containing protein [Streptomyces sp. TRM76130]
TSWTADGVAEVVDDAGRLNERNRNYLRLGAGSSVSNAGYNTGIHVERGKKYDFSVWVRAESGTTLTVSLEDAAGT